MELSKSEREEAIKKLKESTSVAKYAFIEKFGLNTWKEFKLKVKRRIDTDEAS